LSTRSPAKLRKSGSGSGEDWEIRSRNSEIEGGDDGKTFLKRNKLIATLIL
jgi:hypothetical protein